MNRYFKVKELPGTLQAALASVGYGRADIGIRTAETYSMRCSGGDGYRAFVVAVNLATGEAQRATGSWGGANMFNPRNPVDLDGQERPLPPGFAVISGHEGGGRPVYASVEVHPSTMAPLLPSAPAAELSALEQTVLEVISGYTSAGRKNEWERMAERVLPWTAPYAERQAAAKKMHADIASAQDRLVSLGLVKRAKNGAMTITTEGRNRAVRR